MIRLGNMKKLLFGTLAVLALVGAGCERDEKGYSREGTGITPVYEDLGPQPAYPGDDPSVSVQGVWAGFVLAVADNHNCDAAKKYLTPSIQPSFNATACKQMEDYIMTVPSIDWSKTETSADKKKVTLHNYEGGFFGEYLVGTDGAWYLNTKVWVR
jgi:hypothetical protein